LTRSVLTVLKFPSYNDRFFKYQFRFKPVGDEQPSFQPILMQKVGNEMKPLYSKQTNTISFFPSRVSKENQGIEIYVWMDPAVRGFDFSMSLNIYGTLGNLIAIYKTALISYSIAVLIMVYGYILSGYGNG
jgi:hypothetical protein